MITDETESYDENSASIVGWASEGIQSVKTTLSSNTKRTLTRILPNPRPVVGTRSRQTKNELLLQAFVTQDNSDPNNIKENLKVHRLKVETTTNLCPL